MDKNPFVKDENQDELEQTSTTNENETSEENTETEVQQEVEEEKDDFKVQYEELNNKYIRLAADFDNFRKRTLQEKQELADYTIGEVLKKITSVLDTFDRAKEHLKSVENCDTVKESYELAYKQLLDTLKKIGMEEIDALGKDFNPNEHEAITQVQTDEYEPDKVAVIAQKGYKIKDKIIRPALVGVAIQKAETKENE